MKNLITTLVLFLIIYSVRAQTYKTYLQTIEQKRLNFSTELNTPTNKDSILLEAGKFLEQELVNKHFSYWKGTPWDFNGYTNIPQQGTIACGYYVSTSLKHLGFNLNRYRMAQQSALSEIKTIDKDYQIFNTSGLEFISHAKSHLSDGLYIIGLSNHVGFLYINSNNVYFLHSGYVEPFGVCKEVAGESEVFNYSTVYVVGNISNNKELIKKWLLKKEITIVYD